MPTPVFCPFSVFTYYRSSESFATEIIPQKPRLCHSEKDGDEFAEKIFKIVLDSPTVSGFIVWLSSRKCRRGSAMRGVTMGERIC